jgi:hypothetical protein
MEILVSLERLLEELYLLVAFDALGLRIRLALAVPFHLVQPHHLLDSVFVLFLDTELELELRQHELDAGTQMWGVISDQVWQKNQQRFEGGPCAKELPSLL